MLLHNVMLQQAGAEQHRMRVAHVRLTRRKRLLESSVALIRVACV
jgi:hypothetical protein